MSKAPKRLLTVLAAALFQGCVDRPAVELPAQLPADEPLAVTELVSGTNVVLQAVSPVSEDTVWISGHGGVVLRTSDGGDSWQRAVAPGGDTLQFRDVHGFSWPSAVVLSSGPGNASRIYRTDDGGAAWTLQFLMEEPEGFLDCLDFWDEDRGFAYGDAIDDVPYILVTENGGQGWTRVTRGAAPAARDGEGGFAASGTCARAGPGGTGWIGAGAGGSARVFSTADYGRSWTAVDIPVVTGPSAGVFTLAMASGRPVLALGGDLGAAGDITPNAASSSDGGSTWTAVGPAPVPGAVYGSAGGQDAAGREWVVAVAPPRAAYTTDAGVTWRHLPDVSAWAVAFAPAGRLGWAAGGEGRIWRLEW